jgi:hypothetical protein
MSPIEARLGIHLDAIIGLDAIGDQDFAIDYHERRILFGAQAPNGHSVSFELRHQAGAPYLVVLVSPRLRLTLARTNCARMGYG